jgi:GntR family transcriptional regulator of vanillate catabolism
MSRTDPHPNHCYATLRALVLAGRFEMGERLGEDRLASELGTSRTPVRAALARLVADGYVTYSPHRGHRMKVYSADDVREIYACRAVLESEAVRLLAEQGASDAQLEALHDLVRRMDDCIGAETRGSAALRARYLTLNHAFHAALYAACPNAHLRSLVDQLTELPLVIRNFFNFSDEEFLESHLTHRRILSAIVNRESLRAASLMREHIWVARDRMLDPRVRPGVAPAEAPAAAPRPNPKSPSNAAVFRGATP